MPGSSANRVTAEVERALAWTLAACLMTFAVAKLAYGHREALQVGVTVYYLASGVELVAAGLLLTRHRLVGAGLTAAFFTVALLHSWLTGATNCGCLGPIALSTATYRMLAASLGLGATWILWSRTAPPTLQTR